MKSLHFPLWKPALVLCGALLSCGLSVQADERSDYREWANFLKKLNAMDKVEPQEKIALYDGFLQGHPQLDPDVAVVVETYKANVYAKSLNDPEGALKLLEEARVRYGGASQARIVRFETEILAAQKRWPEVEELLQANWPSIVEGKAGTRDAAYLARNYAWALEGRPAEIAAAIAPLLSRTPELWSGAEQWPPGALYDVLVSSLIAEKKTDEALGWAKLQYQLSAFDAASLERSTKLLTRVWAARDDFPAIAAFTKSQSDASAPNPLAEIKVPALDEKILQVPAPVLATLTPATSSAKISEMITLDLAAKRYGVAMQRAQQLLQTRLETGEGASEVARVFKAADLNLVRANAFLSYLKGEGENPFPDFYAKYGDGDAATAQR